MGMNLGSSLSTGQLVGRCRVIRLLGRGGMGEVYLAEHLSLQKPVALKILPPDLGNKDRVERFFKEARTCSRIEHPNVVVIHDVGASGGLYYIVMQYVQGKNLAELLQEHGGPLPWRSAVRLIQLAARGLHAVHSHGLVHRDIKPSNIMLSVDSRVLLMDFGLVRKELESSLTRTGQVVGTPSFMSPEQCRGKALDRRSDIYSLGGTLYCMLTGSAPFQGSLQEVVVRIAGGKRPRPVSEVNRTVPSKVSDVVAKSMAANPQDRFQTAAAMARELKKLLRASQLVSTTAWITGEISAAHIDTQPVPDLPQIELLPLETRWESVQRKLPWIAVAGGIFAGLLLLGLLLRLLLGGDSGDRVERQVGRQSVGQSATDNQQPGSRQRADTSNMVFIEEGYARLGISNARLTDYLESLSLLEGNDLVRELSLLQARQLADLEPQERVVVPAFWIDKYEVTNAEYAQFVEYTGYEAPDWWEGSAPPSGTSDHPVHGVRRRDAEAYARWAGKELPTREQWMRAFRGDNDWLFPWGDEFDASRANVLENPESPPSTTRVAATPNDKTMFGVFNMVGNVCEYVQDQASIGGQPVDIAKGASFAQLGQGDGIGPMSTVVQKGATGPQLGFRCVVEMPQAAPANAAQNR